MIIFKPGEIVGYPTISLLNNKPSRVYYVITAYDPVKFKDHPLVDKYGPAGVQLWQYSPVDWFLAGIFQKVTDEERDEALAAMVQKELNKN